VGGEVRPAAVFIPGSTTLDASQLGGKAANLLRVSDAGLPVPRWIAMPADVHARLVLGDAAAPQNADEADQRRTATLSLAIPAELRDLLQRALRDSHLLDTPLAVRSSATSEDSAAASFAGQFETVLGVVASEDDDAALWDAIRRVWASAFGLRALAYAGSEAALAAPPAMAVILQELVDARAAGVAFSIDPVTGATDTAVVSAVYGLGEGLVSGELDADTFRVTGGAIDAAAADKDHAHLRQPDGSVARVEVPASLRRASSISEQQARAVADAARRLAAALGAPQDVEWAFAANGPDAASTPMRAPTEVADAPSLAARLAPRPDERLLILQARPVTAAGVHAPAGELRVWDNSNIIESYAGLTSPLTFSFARSVYEEVYIQFCRLSGVTETVMAEQRHVFANMLGLIRGRVYYNLLNWYRLLALLPGYAFNRAFMERMMGVREKLAEPPDPPKAANRWVDLGRLLRSIARLERANRRLSRDVPAFHARVEASLGPLAGEDLARRSPDDLLRLYRQLEDRLLRHWRAPLVNDFFAMIWFGVLGRLVERWLPAEPATLANDLLCGEGGIVSTEPAKRVMALARRVSDEPALAALFAAEPDDHALLRRLHGDPAGSGFRAELKRYLDRFGDRCMSELKLETVTPAEDPTWVVTMVRAYVAGGAIDPEGGSEREQAIRRAAEARVAQRLSGVRRRVFMRVLRNARVRIRDRENLRFERTRVFGVVRRIFVAVGEHFARSGRIDDVRDIFWLTKDEVFAEVDGTGTTKDLRTLVRLRREEYARYEAEPAPPDRFTTRGLPGEAIPAAAGAALAEGDDLRGIGCCPGVVRAPVKIVRDPKEAGDLKGRILVAERTDPGWTLLFPTASGILVQRGSLLSHSAIVAREMGIPCVVAIPGLLETLADGELVEMDGTTGLVRRAGS
jgi:rifampicin phosphotransferase